MLLARCTEPSAASAAFCFRQAKNSDSAFRLPLCPGMGKPMENHRLHGDFMGKPMVYMILVVWKSLING